MPETEYDVFRDSPLRLLGYANEAAEAFRPVIHRYAVYSGYWLASGYMLADVVHKTNKSYQNGEPWKNCAMMALDVTLWQGAASLVIPSLAINRFSATSRYIMQNIFKVGDKKSKLISVILSIGIIPFLVKPVDKSVDYVMDNHIRKYLGTKTE